MPSLINTHELMPVGEVPVELSAGIHHSSQEGRRLEIVSNAAAAALEQSGVYRQHSNHLQEVLADKESQLEEAQIDTLTGLGNRAALLKDLEVQHKQKQRGVVDYAVALIDLDGLKKVNDDPNLQGHESGDSYIKGSTEIFKGKLREGDRLYRYGGDELVAIIDLARDSEEEVKLLEERLSREAMSEEFKNLAQQLGFQDTLGASIGVVKSDSNLTPKEMLQIADTRMYESKRANGTAREV